MFCLYHFSAKIHGVKGMELLVWLSMAPKCGQLEVKIFQKRSSIKDVSSFFVIFDYPPS